MRSRAVYILLIAATGLALTATAPEKPVLAFARVHSGAWLFRTLDGSVPPRKLCLRNADELIQLQHPGGACSRFVLVNEAESATVHYTCPGAGYGRTVLTVETGDLIKLESQGLVNGAPFEIRMEGRRIGDCGQDGQSR